MKKKNKKSSYIFLSVITTGIFVLIGTALLINSNKSRVITLDYNENDRITYKVLLNNNEYMDEDLEYNTNEIDDIEIKYYYDIEFSEDLDTTLNNYVYSTIKVVDENNTVIYKKEEEMKSEKTKEKSNKILYEKPIIIDYSDYKDIVKDYASSNCSLIIEFDTNQKSESKTFSDILRDRSMSIEIPLSNDTIKINKTPNIVDDSSYTEISTSNKTNTILFILSIISYVLSAISIIVGWVYINKKN